ncbi:hypothetical protein [Intestinibacter sp.]|uniref:hypothetical protein n=1 Tax=Intestinibacter sp. TaxID=1965304 RepID=UPI003F141B01
MIKLTNKTAQDFLNEEWSDKLSEYIEMNDAKYVIKDGYIFLKEEITPPYRYTYTLSELLYKLAEYYTGNNNSFFLSFIKDAPYYCFYYKGDKKDSIGQFHEYPIESAAHLLIECVKNNIAYAKDISSK